MTAVVFTSVVMRWSDMRVMKRGQITRGGASEITNALSQSAASPQRCASGDDSQRARTQRASNTISSSRSQAAPQRRGASPSDTSGSMRQTRRWLGESCRTGSRCQDDDFTRGAAHDG